MPESLFEYLVAIIDQKLVVVIPLENWKNSKLKNTLPGVVHVFKMIPISRLKLVVPENIILKPMKIKLDHECFIFWKTFTACLLQTMYSSSLKINTSDTCIQNDKVPMLASKLVASRNISLKPIKIKLDYECFIFW